MLALAFAATLASATPSAAEMARGEWLVVAVQRVIAPDQMQGQCFVQGRVEQVVHGRAFRPGDAVALSVPCRAGGPTPAAVGARPDSPTVQALWASRRALVHTDAAGRVLENGFYGLEAATPARPGAL